jgi:hypothetical protein
MINNTGSRPTSKSPIEGALKPKIPFLWLENHEHHEIAKADGVGPKGMIQYLDRGELILVASKHAIGKENVVNVVVLTEIHFSHKEPNQPTKKSPAIHLDEDVSKPWYFTHG